MWFDDWADVLRVLAVGSTSYVALVLLLRASGKRTLSQLNAFDFIVTVALGSTLATILLSSDVSWVEGVTALVLLVGLQFGFATVSARWPRTRAAMTSTPAVLLRDGEILLDTLERSRLTESEVRQAVRSAGAGDLALVAAVVLETDGKLSVITTEQVGDGSALADVADAGSRRDA
ncbi:DUF421 domain-containing protein [Amnibacterium endophyticum]|uniref:DUF421 domain-containing protein n=1 Tax=Amnibacterium endophyticum TaxID=2109337 RepID=A0ABW4LBC7_9MICO